MKVATETFAWIVIVLIGLIGLAIIFQIFRGKIDLTSLISESDGKGSMSRLQFLIFTFVIAGSFFLITISSNPPKFPAKIPGEVLALLGISGGSYVLGKGVQASKETQVHKNRTEVQREQILSDERKGLSRRASVVPPTVGQTDAKR